MRLVQFGVGRFGASWASLAQATPGIELVGIVDPNPAARARAAEELELAEAACFPDLDAALAGADWDAALVVTPPATHAAVATALLRAGKHVLVEKPLATSLEDARVMVATAAETGRILMVSQNYRFRPPARAIQAAIAAGAIGPLVAVEIEFRRDTRWLRPPTDFRYAMAHPLVLDMVIHHADLLRALTGRGVRRVYAQSWRVPNSPYAYDPAVVAVLTLAGGATVVYQGDWGSDEPPTSWNGEWVIAGEAGELRWMGGVEDANVGEVTLRRWGEPPRPVEQPVLAAVDRAGSLAAFQAAVASGQEPETSARDNFHSLAVILPCVEAIERDQVVAVAG